MAYESIPLTEDIHIDQLYTVHILNTEVIFLSRRAT